jgi:hypothetical protein
VAIVATELGVPTPILELFLVAFRGGLTQSTLQAMCFQYVQAALPKPPAPERRTLLPGRFQ